MTREELGLVGQVELAKLYFELESSYRNIDNLV